MTKITPERLRKSLDKVFVNRKNCGYYCRVFTHLERDVSTFVGGKSSIIESVIVDLFGHEAYGVTNKNRKIKK